MINAVMLLSNPFKPDPRVLKEAEVLQKNGFHITILCWDRQAELEPEEKLSSGIRIIRIQNISSSYGIGIHQLSRIPRFWVALIHLLKIIGPSIIHCHDFDTLPAGLWFGLIHRIPVIYDAHEYYAELVKPRLHGFFGWFIYKAIKWAEQIGAKFSSAVITVDDTLGNHYKKSNHRVIILGHYPKVEMAEFFNPVFTRPDLTLVYSGRISADRGIFIYVDMVRKLIQKGIPAQLNLIGIFTPESEKIKFDDYAKNMDSSIHYLGWLPYEQVSSIYRNADIGLAILLPEPRYVAAIPIKLFEYMASGLPVIASDFPSIAQIVNEVKCGLLVNPQSDLADTIDIIELWWIHRSIPQTMGEQGRNAILSNYNWDNHSRSLIDLYHDLV